MGNGRIKKTAILLSTALLVTGCSGGNTAVEELSADTAFYTYPVGNAVTFDVSGDGTVYTIESENGDLLCSYTLSGERSEIAELPQKTDSDLGELFHSCIFLSENQNRYRAPTGRTGHRMLLYTF